jgi:hypothetical protein
LNLSVDRRYRLFSARRINFYCLRGYLLMAGIGGIITDNGLEGPLAPDRLIIRWDLLTFRASGLTFDWSVKGKPHWIAELAFQEAHPRFSKYIWHQIVGEIQCLPDGNARVDAAIKGSQYPCHTLFINDIWITTIMQGPLASLWVPDLRDLSLVR